MFQSHKPIIYINL